MIPVQAGDTRELRWNGSEWRVKSGYHVGDLLLQYPLEDSPVVKRLEGDWVHWTYRSMLYGIRDTPPPGDFITDWLSKRHDIWHLNTDGSVATQGTKKWGKTGGGMPEGHIVIARESAVKLADPDLTEGDQITAGPYAGKYVWQNIVPAGIFWSVDDSDPTYQGGGFRPPFPCRKGWCTMRQNS
ncbi:MAG: hypothetical protein LBK74_08600 [Treponema sp.]|nr:hypothetical protein [Treponema sp.]